MGKLLYKDKAGNKLLLEGKVLAVRNQEGKLVTKKDTDRLIRKAVREKPSILHMKEWHVTERPNMKPLTKGGQITRVTIHHEPRHEDPITRMKRVFYGDRGR
jgi:hypothetical protein